MSKNGETNFVITMAFLAWLITRNDEKEKDEQTKYTGNPEMAMHEDMDGFLKQYKTDTKDAATAAYKQKSAEYDVRLREAMEPYYKMNPVRWVDTRLFGDWASYSGHYNENMSGL